MTYLAISTKYTRETETQTESLQHTRCLYDVAR